jgi:hypothetical protein
MKQIFVISAFFLVLILASVGCLYIFAVMTFEASKSIALKSAAAIVLLGVSAALIKLLVSGRKEPQD